MRSIHILLVEDNEGDILLTIEAIKDRKITNTINVMKDGWEAIKYIERKGEYENAIIPDLIILDVNLPKMNGHEVLEKIKSNITLRHIPVIMLTTSSAENDILKSYQNYANCYITKPADVDDFIEVVSSIESFWNSIVQLPSKMNN